MKTQLIIFDMDGLMFNTEEVYFHAWSKVLEEEGLKPNLDVFVQSMGISEEKGLGIYKDYYGVDFKEIELTRRLNVYFGDSVKNGEIKIKTGLLELLDYLHANHIKAAIGSSSAMQVILSHLERMNVSVDRFDYILSGASLKETKPNPEIFNKICKELNIENENAMVLEDSFNGLKAANNANIKCIMIPDLLKPNDEIRSMTYKIIDDLNGVIEYLKTEQ